MMKKRIIITTIILITSFANIYPQETERYLEIRGRAELDMQPLNGATATLFDGNTKVNSVRTGSDGLFSFKLEVNKYYVVEVGKEKYISKRLAFDTSLPDEEKGIWVREFAMSVVKSCDGVDYSALSQPVDVIKYNPKRKDFESDKDHLTKMRSRLEHIGMANEQCLAEKYDNLIKEADKAMANKQFEEAREKYTAASEIFPNETYPKQKSSQIEQQVSKLENVENLYAKTIGEADALMTQNKHEEALAKFKAASILKPQENYPKQKAAEVEKLLADVRTNQQAAATQDARYNNIISKANAEMAAKNFEAAKQLYQQALQIKPGDLLSQGKIAEAERAAGLQQQQVAEKNKSLETEKAYQQALVQADNLYKNKEYAAALEAYNKALSLKPNEAYAKQRASQLSNMLTAEEAKKQRETDAGYQNALAAAEKASTAKDFQTAKGYYQQALQFRPDDAALKNKLDEMNRLMAQETQNKQQQEEIRKQYLALVQNADQLYAAKNLDAAKNAYREAHDKKPDEQYPLQRIQEIERQVLAEKTREQQKNQENYQNAVNTGNSLLTQKQYQKAIESFKQALIFKPGDVFAQNKISETENLIKQEQTQLAALQAKKTDYNGIITGADRLFSSKDYASAKSEYQRALQVLPAENYPKQRIQEIDRLLTLAEAEKQRELESGFRTALNAGNNYMAQKSYTNAKNSFQEALTYKPDDVTVKNRIAEVDNLIRQEQTQLAALQAKKTDYNGIITGADRLFSSKDYASAKSEYQRALQVLPAENYPKQRIQEIDRLLTLAEAEKQRELESGYRAALNAGNNYMTQKSYTNAKNSFQEALTYKPDDVTVKNSIAEVDNLIRQEQAQMAAMQANKTRYDGFISNADRFFTAKDYLSAKAEYLKATQVLPEEQYPKQRVQEIDRLVAEDARVKRETENKYQTAINTANSYFSQKSYANAKTSYQEALNYKPDDNLAKNRVLEIDNILKQQMAEQAASQAKQKQYDDLIARADGLFNQKNYTAAKVQYTSALQVISGQTYPQQKISEIDRLLADEQRILAENQAKENAYSQSVKKADGLFSARQYEQAKAEYNNALVIKPAEVYPKNRISEIDRLLLQQQQEMAKETGYKNAVEEADRLFTEKKYSESKASYSKALGFRPAEQYPKSQITKIDNLLAETEKQRQQELAKQKQYDGLIAEADKLFSANKYPQAKEIYQNALAIKPDEQYPRARIARIDEIYALVAQQQKKQGSTTTATAQKPATTAKKAVPAELKFKNDSEKDIYLAGLKKEYPDGVTLEVYKEQYKVTSRYIVIRGNEVNELREIFFSTYGGREYSINGKPITQMYFESQVKPRDGEKFTKYEF